MNSLVRKVVKTAAYAGLTGLGIWQIADTRSELAGERLAEVKRAEIAQDYNDHLSEMVVRIGQVILKMEADYKAEMGGIDPSCLSWVQDSDRPIEEIVGCNYSEDQIKAIRERLQVLRDQIDFTRGYVDPETYYSVYSDHRIVREVVEDADRNNFLWDLSDSTVYSFPIGISEKGEILYSPNVGGEASSTQPVIVGLFIALAGTLLSLKREEKEDELTDIDRVAVSA